MSAATTDLDSDTQDDVIAEHHVDPTFRVHNDDSANWVVRKILESRAYVKHCAEWCEREQARAKRAEEFFLFRYGQQLLDYAKAKIAAAGGRRKSVNLPAGAVGFRSEAPKLVIDDEGAVVEWAKIKAPQVVIVIERLSKSALNELLEVTGEMPSAGAHLEPAREKFYIK